MALVALQGKGEARSTTGVTSPRRLGVSLSGVCLACFLPSGFILLREPLMGIWFLEPPEAALRGRSG